MSFSLIETKTLGTAAASIEFTSIPQTFTDLVLLTSLRGSEAGGSGNVNGLVTFNNETSNRTERRLFGNGSTAGTDTETQIRFTNSSTVTTANTFGNATIYVPNYTGPTSKSVSIDSVMENNATFSLQMLTAGLWNNSAAITSVKVQAASGDFLADSTISLYGILKGSSGGVTVS